MARYDSAIATAKRLIQKDGQTVTWSKSALTPIDPDQPWLGDTSVVTNYTPFVCFVPASGGFYTLIQYLKGTEVPKTGTYGLMAPQAFMPEITDLVMRNNSPLKIATIDTLQPNEQVVLHILGLEA